MKELFKKDLNKINKAINNVAPGRYTDEYWDGALRVWNALSDVCADEQLQWELDESFYNTDEFTGELIRKTWRFRVTDGKRESFGIVVAAACGTVQDPLSVYDIVSYI